MKYILVSLLVSMQYYMLLFARENYNVIHPSVNAEQFKSGASAEYVMNKGIVSMTIPLFEMKCKGFVLPISLVFNPENVNYRTQSGQYGLGWSLMAGGVVSVTIRDRNDSLITSCDDAPWLFNENYLNVHEADLNRLFNGDTMPDDLFFSIPGYSGQVVMKADFDGSLNFHTWPDDECKIERTNNGYKVTDESGNKYYLEEKEYNLTPSTNAHSSQVTAWYLSRIETYHGGHFYFDYVDRMETDYEDGVFEIGTHFDFAQIWTKDLVGIRSDYDTLSIEAYRVDIHGIITPVGKTLSLRRKDSDIIRGYNLRLTDLIGQGGLTSIGRKSLSCISPFAKRRNGSDAASQPSYEFGYESKFGRDYDDRSINEEDPLGYDDSDPGAKGSWTSTAVAQMFVDLKMSGAEVRAGTINNFTTIEQDYGFSLDYSDYSDYTEDDFFILTSVQYPSGAYEEFEYEPHDFDELGGKSVNVNDLVGVAGFKSMGKRIKTRTVRESVYGEVCKTTNYYYRIHNPATYDKTGLSSGVLVNPTLHSSTAYSLAQDDQEFYLRARQVRMSFPQNSRMGLPITYKEVEEEVLDGSLSHRTIYYYNIEDVRIPQNYIHFYDFQNLNNFYYNNRIIPLTNTLYGRKSRFLPQADHHNDRDYCYMAYPIGPFSVKEHVSIDRTVTLDNNSSVARIIEYTYGPYAFLDRYGYTFVSTTGNPYHQPNIGDRVTTLISRSDFSAVKRHLTKVKTIDYYGGQRKDSVIVTYGYNKGRLARESVRGLNSTIQTDYKYVDSEDGVPSSPVHRTMLSQNLLSYPIQVTKVKNNDNILEGKYYEYTTSGNYCVEQSTYTHPITYCGNRHSVRSQMCNAFYEDATLHYLPNNYLPYYSTTPAGVTQTFLWGEQDCLLASIESESYISGSTLISMNSLAQQLDNIHEVTIANLNRLKGIITAMRQVLPAGSRLHVYTHDPVLGVTSVYDSFESLIIYTYDVFGRLVRITDDQGHTIEKYSYNYAH